MFEKFFVSREQNVNKLRCAVMSRMMFRHQKAVVIVLLSACLYRKGSMHIHCLLCRIRVSASICNYTNWSVESLSLETLGREGYFKIFYWIFSFTSRDICSAFKALCFVYQTKVGIAVAQWLRCCATNRKVARSIPASVMGFFIDVKFFRLHYGSGVDSASNRNEYQEHFLGVRAAGA